MFVFNSVTIAGINMDGEYMYFFTKRDRKYVNGKNTARVTRDGRGYWKSTSKKTKVCAQDGSELGKKTTLKYRFKNSAGGKVDIPAEWIMHEYVISNKLVYPSISSKEDEYVCIPSLLICLLSNFFYVDLNYANLFILLTKT